jgi:type IV secretion system protein VirB4
MLPVLSPRRSVMDAVPWDLLVAEGVLRNTDGALTAAFRYRGPDPASATAAALHELMRVLSEAIAPLGTGWLLHFDSLRLPAPAYPATAPEAESFAVTFDEERRRQFADGSHFVTEQFLTLTQLPERSAREGLSGALAKLRRPASPLAVDERVLERFSREIEQLRSTLATHLRIHRLSSQELVQHLYRCLTCRQHPVNLPSYPVSLESILGAGELYGGLDLRFAETHIAVIAIPNFPEELYPSALSFLDRHGAAHRVNVRLIALDPFDAEKQVRKIRGAWISSGVRLMDIFVKPEERSKDRLVDAMVEDADEASFEVRRHHGSAGFVTTNVILWDLDRRALKERVQEYVADLRNHGFAAWEETWGAPAAFLGSLPAVGRYNRRRPLVTTRAVAHLAPTASLWYGLQEHPHPELRGESAQAVVSTRGSDPFYFTPAFHDVLHATIFGSTGAGKSTLVAFLIATLFARYDKAQVWSIDKGYSQLLLAHALGGVHYALDLERPLEHEGGSGARFAPLAHLDTPTDRTRALEWLVETVRLQGVEPTSRDKKLLQETLEELALTPRRNLTLFAARVPAEHLRTALRPYTENGPYGALFDAFESTLREGRYHVIEMEHLLQHREEVVAPLVLNLFSEIERSLSTGKITYLFIEEAFNFLSRTLFAERFQRWLFDLRKKNGGVVLVTQSPHSVLESPIAAAVQDSCKTRFFCPDASASEKAEGYGAFGLSSREVQLLSEAVPRRDYYVASPSGSRLFDLRLSERALSVLGVSGEKALEVWERFVQPYPEEWLARYWGEVGL